MRVIFCKPELTMAELGEATVFFNESSAILDEYVANVHYIRNSIHINQLLAEEANKNDILVFFTSEIGKYNDVMLRLLRKYNDAQCRIWAIAMEGNPECRMPPEPITEKQSFDVSCRKENRNPLRNNIKAIAQLLITLLSFGTLSFISSTWSLIEGVMILVGTINIDGEGNPLGE